MKKLNLNQNQNLSLFNAINILKVGTALMLLIAGLQSPAYAGQGGDGGALTTQGTKVITFYSAGIKVFGEKNVDNIPGMQEAINAINSNHLFSSETSGRLTQALYPTKNRTYYDVDPKFFDKTTEARILAEYARLTGEPVNKLKIAAVTDPATGETLLLPNFYKLQSKIQQAAILFHESRWILNPKAGYNNVIRDEFIFEKVLTHPNDVTAQFELVKRVGYGYDLLQFSIYADLLSGAINSNSQLQNSNGNVTINAEKLLGQEFINCKLQDSSNDTSLECSNILLHHIIMMQSQFENSFLLKCLSFAISADIIRIELYQKNIYLNNYQEKFSPLMKGSDYYSGRCSGACKLWINSVTYDDEKPQFLAVTIKDPFILVQNSNAALRLLTPPNLADGKPNQLIEIRFDK